MMVAVQPAQRSEEGGGPGRLGAADSSPSGLAWSAPGPVLALVAGGAVVGLATWHLSLPHPLAFPCDDAYITLHNAEVLLAGGDAAYPGVSPLTGATSLPHLALVTALRAILSAPWALLAAAWLGLLLYALALARLARACGLGVAAGTALLLAGLGAGLTAHQLFNGLETGLALAGTTWALALAAQRPAPRATTIGLVCGTLPYLRPELALLALLLLLREARRRPRRQTIRLVAAALAAALPWAVAYLVSQGLPFPQSGLVKRHFFAEECWPLGRRITVAGGHLWQFAATLGPLLLGLPLLVCSSLGRIGLCFLAGLVLAFALLFPGALGHYEHRYLQPVVPLLLLGLALAAARPGRRAVRLAGTIALVATCAYALVGVPAALRLDSRNSAFTRGELGALASFCRRHLPAGARLLVHDAGYLAHATDLELVDLVGLKTPAAARVHRQVTWPSCGQLRGEAVHRIAMAHRPHYLVVLSGWDRTFHISGALWLRGWGLDPLRPAWWIPPPWLAQLPLYNVYRLTPPTPGQPRQGSPPQTVGQ